MWLDSRSRYVRSEMFTDIRHDQSQRLLNFSFFTSTTPKTLLNPPNTSNNKNVQHAPTCRWAPAWTQSNTPRSSGRKERLWGLGSGFLEAIGKSSKKQSSAYWHIPRTFMMGSPKVWLMRWSPQLWMMPPRLLRMSQTSHGFLLWTNIFHLSLIYYYKAT